MSLKFNYFSNLGINDENLIMKTNRHVDEQFFMITRKNLSIDINFYPNGSISSIVFLVRDP